MVRPAGEKRWMLRLVGVAAALTERGYPAGTDGEVRLAVDDPQRPDNTGTWRLTVAKGSGRAERIPAGAGDLRLGPRGLAALYAGTPLPALRTAGLVATSERQPPLAGPVGGGVRPADQVRSGTDFLAGFALLSSRYVGVGRLWQI